MTCQGCAGTVERTLRGVRGAGAVAVDRALGKAVVAATAEGGDDAWVAALLRAVDGVANGKFRASVAEATPAALVDLCSPPPRRESVTLKVEGMTCQGCANTVERTLRGVRGVGAVSVDCARGEAVVVAAADGGDDAWVAELLRTLGGVANGKFHSSVAASASADLPRPPLPFREAITLKVAGMTCSGCAMTVERALRSAPGVSDASVDLATGRAVIHATPECGDDAWVAFLVQAVGRVANGKFSASVDDSPSASAAVPPLVQALALKAPIAESRQQSVAIDLRDVKKTNFIVHGMTCASCTAKVEGVVSRLDGVTSVSVNLLAQSMQVWHSAREAPPGLIARVVQEAGYTAECCDTDEGSAESGEGTLTLRLARTGAAAPEVALRVAGVTAAVHMGTTLQVRFRRDFTSARAVFDAVDAAGWVPSVVDVGGGAEAERKLHVLSHADEIAHYRRSFLWSLAFAVPMLFVSMLLPSGAIFESRVAGAATARGVLEALLAAPVQLWLALPFYRSAFASLRRKDANMDVLIVLGTSAAYGFSLFSLLLAAGDPSYQPELMFETAVFLLTFVLLGRYLENHAKGRTSRQLTRLITQQAAVATLVEEGRTPRTIDARLVQRGDVLRVGVGDRVPADGELLHGNPSLDKSLITGESMPVAMLPGDELVAGAVVCNGIATMRARRVGAETMLAQMARLVEEVQSSKPPMQRLADKIASVFVPSIVALAIVTFLVWYALVTLRVGHVHEWKKQGESDLLFAFTFAISALVIACPCAMGLATPTAVMVGSGLAARHGALVKEGRAFEAASRLSAVVLDKTGTLTTGCAEVTDFVVLDDGGLRNVTSDSLLELVAATESTDRHPLARAIAAHARARGLHVDGVVPEHHESTHGEGVRASVMGHDVVVGKYEFVVRFACETVARSSPPPVAAAFEDEGKTCVYALVDSRALCVAAVADSLRHDSRTVVDALRQRWGVAVWLATGDSPRVAGSVARAVGIDEAHTVAGCLPRDKAELVKQLQARGEVVAVVGDGTNDAPALAQADVGVAIASGSDVAAEAADIVLVRPGVASLLDAFDIARRTFARIRINLIWAMAYNCVAIPVAAGAAFPLIHPVVLPPMAAGLAMALSSVSVVVSSLLLPVDFGHLLNSLVPAGP
eukprot:TRINITY_DN617_c0_g1_i6.p1 TRINITY_DN617_c0_g1~~TRINITY_DN617_c0_g1_i6.p1  ORF type:complete len:1238 (+),score=268.07 TRINITY_DN617_c0_g1_i6:282-3716(+)